MQAQEATKDKQETCIKTIETFETAENGRAKCDVCCAVFIYHSAVVQI